MPLICPKCGAGSLKIEASMEIPPDSRSDEITLQILSCMRCGLSGIGVYEESRRGALDYESFDHRGYYVDSSFMKYLTNLMSECPEPNNPRCNCPSHSELKSIDMYGRWNWLNKIQEYGVFKLKYRNENISF